MSTPLPESAGGPKSLNSGLFFLKYILRIFDLDVDHVVNLLLIKMEVDVFHVEWYAAKAKREWLKHCLRVFHDRRVLGSLSLVLL